MKFNVNDYPGDYVMFCDSSDEAAEFAEVLNAQGKTLLSGSSYLTIPHYARAFFFQQRDIFALRQRKDRRQLSFRMPNSPLEGLFARGARCSVEI